MANALAHSANLCGKVGKNGLVQCKCYAGTCNGGLLK